MSRHRSHDILDQVVSGTLPVDQETTRIIPRGDDDKAVPVNFFTTKGNQLEHVTVADIEQDHISSSGAIGLGGKAVAAALNRTYHELHGFPLDRQENDQQGEITRTRKFLASMSPGRAKMLEEAWGQQHPPEWLRERLRLTEDVAPTEMISAMTKPRRKREILKDRLRLKKKAQEQVYQLPDETVLNFLEWHNHLLAEKQKDLDSRINGYKSRFISSIYKAVEQGWVDEVPPSLGYITDVSVVVDDGLLTYLHPKKSAGYTTRDRNHIVISPRELEKPRKLLAHEFTHLIEGADINSGEAEEDRIRGLRRLFGPGRGGTVMNEAIVEHFSNSLLVGGIDSTKPNHPKREQATYQENRGLLHYLVEFGVKHVDVRYFTAALFENRYDPKPDSEDAQTALYSQLREAFPFADVVKEIQNFDENTDVDTYILDLDRRTQEYKSSLVAA